MDEGDSIQMTRDDYYEHRVWSYSSAKHLYGPYPNERKAVESLLGLGTTTSSMNSGTALHSLLLDKDPKIASASSLGFDNFKTKASREIRDMKMNAGWTILSNTQFDEANAMAESVRNHPVVKKHGLLAGEHEVSNYTKVDGIDFRFRPDIICVDAVDNDVVVADLKTVQDVVLYGGFEKSFEDYGYAYQAALYSMGVADKMKLPRLPRFIFIAVDTNGTVGVYEVSKSTMELGIQMVRDSVKYIKEHHLEDTSTITPDDYQGLLEAEKQAERDRIALHREILDNGITTI
jgi:hypothetical protein